MRDFIQALPKTETHLHLEGALPYELLTQWDPEQWPPDPLFRSRSYRYETFPEFERILLDHALPWFTRPSDITTRPRRSSRNTSRRMSATSRRASISRSRSSSRYPAPRSSRRFARRCRRDWRSASL